MTKASEIKAAIRSEREGTLTKEQSETLVAYRADNRRRKNKERAVERAALTGETEQEWWAGNRATLPPDKLVAMVALDAHLNAVLESMTLHAYPGGARMCVVRT